MLQFISGLIMSLVLAWSLCGSITRTARGTNSSTSTGKTLTPSVTAGTTGSSLVVFAFSNLSGRTVSSVAWTGGTFTVLTGCTASDGTRDVEIWRANNVTAGTNTMTITWSGNTAARSVAITEFNSPQGALTDGTCATAGTGSVSPATTGSITCAPNASAQCAWLAVVGVGASTDTITFTHPSTAGQSCSISSTDSCSEGFELDSSSVTQSGSASLGTGAAWAMTMGTLLEPGLSSSGLLLKGVAALDPPLYIDDWLRYKFDRYLRGDRL